MVSTTRYYPSGYIGLEQATVLVCKLRWPERWTEASMLPGEQEMWSGLGWHLNAEAIDYLHFCLKREVLQTSPDADTSQAVDRYCDFNWAVDALRKALHSAELKAEFCDEHGRFDHVQKDGWGGEAGLTILLSGVAKLEHSPTESVCRLLFLPISAVENFAKSASSSEGPQEASPDESEKKPAEVEATIKKTGRAGKYVRTDAKADLMLFRSQQPDVPTFAEDWAYMKKRGWPRLLVENIRRDADVPTREVGDKKS